MDYSWFASQTFKMYEIFGMNQLKKFILMK